MHFIGLLALILPITVSYNLTFTIISVLPAILVSSAVLWLMVQTTFNVYRLLFCSIFLVVGISNMHFLALTALELSAKVYYQPLLYLLSVVIAFCRVWLKYNVSSGLMVNAKLNNLIPKLLPSIGGLN